MRWVAGILLFLSLLFSPAEAANRFLTCNTTCTITASDTSIWGTTTGGTGASVPGSSDAVVLDGATCVGGTTCTATMGSGYNPTWQSITMGACTASTTGCVLDFSANNNSITLSSNTGLSNTGTGTRTLNLGNGTWTIQGTGTVWNFTTVTNLTFNANSSSIVFTATSATARSFATGGKTYNSVSVSANTSGGSFSITTANTIATLNITAPNYIALTGGSTFVITNALSATGTASNIVTFASNTTGTATTISSANNGTFVWTAFRDMTFTGGGTFVATSGLNLGNNSGITITPPSSGGGRIIGGWLLRRDLEGDNDNRLAWLEDAA